MPPNPFHILGLPLRYDLDAVEVQRAYLREAGKWHPDRVADPVRRQEVEQKAAEVNEARRMLESDEERADILLQLLGGPAKEDDKSLPDGLLAEVLEVRQEMEEAMETGDPALRRRFEQWAFKRQRRHRVRVAELFAESGGDPLDEERARVIRRELNAWRYVERMIEQMHPPV